jgi:D-alanine-D-alanine ligase
MNELNTSENQLKEISNVLIADKTYDNISNMNTISNKLEMIDDEYFNDVFIGLSNIFKSVKHYNTPKEFINNIKQHKNDFVFTVYGGYGSRNRMALIPSICESYGIRYAGADTYARILCQDKHLSKEFCKRFDILTPSSILIHNKCDLKYAKKLKFPVVTKPNFEGSSIGVTRESLNYDYSSMVDTVTDMLDKYKQPILIEEFVPGKEVCICMLGTTNEVSNIEAVEVYFDDDEKYFDTNLFTAEEKCVKRNNRKLRLITNEINPEVLENTKRLFKALGKIDLLRIDGKLYNDKFSLLELTPDAHLGKGTQFASAFRYIGIEYCELLAKIINNSLSYYQNQYAND